jgi:hypothetical protein
MQVWLYDNLYLQPVSKVIPHQQMATMYGNGGINYKLLTILVLRQLCFT